MLIFLLSYKKNILSTSLVLTLGITTYHWAYVPTYSHHGKAETVRYSSSQLAILLRGQDVPTWTRLDQGEVTKEVFLDNYNNAYREDGIISIEYYTVKELENKPLIPEKWLSSLFLNKDAAFIKSVRYDREVNVRYNEFQNISSISYHPNGHIKEIINLNSPSLLPGKVEYYPDGKLKLSSWKLPYLNFTRPDGILEQEYHENGNLKREEFCTPKEIKCPKTDLLSAREYYENGHKRKEEFILIKDNLFYPEPEVREYFEDGTVKNIKNPLTKSHTEYYANGQIKIEEILGHPEGLIHIEYFYDGTIKSKTFLLPTATSSLRVETFFMDGNLKKEEWFTIKEKKLVLHREKGPSIVEYDENGAPYKEEWFWQGKHHNTKGPALIFHSSPFCTREWIEFGETQKTETKMAIDCSQHFNKKHKTKM